MPRQDGTGPYGNGPLGNRGVCWRQDGTGGVSGQDEQGTRLPQIGLGLGRGLGGRLGQGRGRGGRFGCGRGIRRRNR